MGKAKGKTLLEVFGEEREMMEQNLNAIQFIIRRAQRAKECVLLTEKDAHDIDELAGEILVQMDAVV